LSLELILHISYLFPVVCFFLFGKKQFRINILLILFYSIAFFFLLIYFETLRDWVNQFRNLKGFYSSFYTFLEYLFFTSFIFLNLSSKALKRLIIYLSIGFVCFQIVYFLGSKFKSLDTVAIGVETILLFTYVISFFYEQFKKPSSISIYNHHCFWICVGILIYLGGSFFFYILANQMTRAEIMQYWDLTYIGEFIKNIFFAFSIYLFVRRRKENGFNNKILPNLDMV